MIVEFQKKLFLELICIKTSKLCGWCMSKKISRRKTVIFELSRDKKPLSKTEMNVEHGFNEYKHEMITAIEKKE